jgi:6-phosphogluconolactonase
VVVLGMGDDGHTASLFPHAAGLATALDITKTNLVRAVHAENAPTTGARMSLTLRAILDSQLIVLLIRGEAKRDAYRKAAAGADVLAAPVRAVLNQTRAPVRVYWSP